MQPIEYSSIVFKIGQQLTDSGAKLLFIMVSKALASDHTNVTSNMIEYMKLFPEKLKKIKEPSQGIDELCYYVALDKDLKQIQEVLKKENDTDLLLYRYCGGHIWVNFPEWFFESFRKNPFKREN